MGFLKEALFKSAASRYAKYLDMLARKGDVEGIKEIAYKLRGSHPSLHPAKAAFGVALGTPLAREITPTELTILAKKSIREGAKVHPWEITSDAPLEKRRIYRLWGDHNAKRSVTPRVPYGEGNANFSPERELTITHGGGYRHIKDFLSGKGMGYDLEAGGKGIQVSPLLGDYKSHRGGLYARRAGFSYGEEPGVLTGKIKAKYLDASPNQYEAGLRPEFLKYLKIKKFRKLQPSSTDRQYQIFREESLGYLPPELKKKMKPYFYDY